MKKKDKHEELAQEQLEEVQGGAFPSYSFQITVGRPPSGNVCCT